MYARIPRIFYARQQLELFWLKSVNSKSLPICSFSFSVKIKILTEEFLCLTLVLEF